MNQRGRILGSFALFGFLAGVLVYFAYNWALPALVAVFPQILEAKWLLWGFVGALLSVTGCVIYATLPET